MVELVDFFFCWIQHIKLGKKNKLKNTDAAITRSTLHGCVISICSSSLSTLMTM